MKIERTKKETSEKKMVCINLSRGIVNQLDSVAKPAKISRTALIEAILEQVLNDKSFTLKI